MKRLLLLMVLAFPLLAGAQNIRIQQLRSDSETQGRIIQADGNGSFEFADLAASGAIDSMRISGNTLEVYAGGSLIPYTADLSAYLDNTDAQVFDVATLAGTVLQLSISGDGEATKTIDLASLQDGTGTDDQTAAEVPITDALGFYNSDNVEGVLQELGGVKEISTNDFNFTPMQINTAYYSSESASPVYIIISGMGTDGVGDYIDVNWIPDYTTFDNPVTGKEWALSRQDGTEPSYAIDYRYAQLITGVDRSLNRLYVGAAYNYNSTSFSVGDTVHYFNPFAGGTVDIHESVVTNADIPYANEITLASGIIKRSNGTYAMIQSASYNDVYHMFEFTSPDLIDWTYQGVFFEPSTNSSDWYYNSTIGDQMLKLPNEDYYLMYTRRTNGDAYDNYGYLKFDENFNDIQVSETSIEFDIPDSIKTRFTGGMWKLSVAYYNGKYIATVGLRGIIIGVTSLDYRLAQLESDSPYGPFTFRKLMYDTDGSNHVSYLAGYANVGKLFVFNDNLYSIVEVCSPWNVSGFQKDNGLALFKYNPNSDSYTLQDHGLWVHTNNCSSLWGLTTAIGHTGGSMSVYAEDGKLYLYDHTTVSTDQYKTHLYIFDAEGTFEGMPNFSPNSTIANVTYNDLDSELTGAVTDNDGSFDFSGSGIINTSISSNTTFSFSNIQPTKSLSIKLTLSGSAVISWNTTPLNISGDEISANGTYLIHVFAWGINESDLEIIVKAL